MRCDGADAEVLEEALNGGVHSHPDWTTRKKMTRNSPSLFPSHSHIHSMAAPFSWLAFFTEAGIPPSHAQVSGKCVRIIVRMADSAVTAVVF